MATTAWTRPRQLGPRVRALREAAGPLAARPRRALRRLRADAQPGRARGDEPDAAGRRPHRRRPRAAALPAPAPRRGRRRHGRARATSAAAAAPRGPPLRGPHAAAARPARRARPATCSRPAPPPAGPGDPPMHEPGSRETAARRRRAPSCCTSTATRHELRAGDCRDLRRRPAAPLREPRKGGGGPAGRRVGRAAPLMSSPRTLFDKIWAAHEVAPRPDLHRPAPRPRGHEPAGVRRPAARRPPGAPAGPHARHRRPQRARPTARRSPRGSRTSSRACRSRRSSATARSSASRSTRSAPTRQGIVHVIGPELGVTQPGMTIVCGDSHTATHGAFGALAFGIGTSEVEHVLATQCLVQRKPRSMRIRYEGDARLRRHRQGPDPRHDRPDRRRRRRRPRRRVRRAGHRGALDGGPHDDLQHDDRGRRPRRHDRPRRDDLRVGRGPIAAPDDFDAASSAGSRCTPTTARRSTREIDGRRRGAVSPLVTWGTNPEQVVGVTDVGPRAAHARARSARCSYMALEPGTPMQEIRLDRVFIGSCTNSPHRRPARRRRGRQGPQGRLRRRRDGRARLAAGEATRPRREGLDEVFTRRRLRLARRRLLDVPGHEPRHRSSPGERCASTSNRNFEGRQGARRAHPPRVARRWRPRRPSRATSSTSATGS